MTESAHEHTHDHPAPAAAHRAGAIGAEAWFGIAALVAATVALVGSIIRVLSDSSPYSNGDFSLAERIAIFGPQISLAAPMLALAALLIDGPSGRRLARFAFVAWAISLVLVAIAEQRGLGKLPY